MNDNLNGCQSPSVTEPQRDGVSAPHRNQSQRAPIGKLGEPAAVKIAKMQGNGLRTVCVSAMSARDSSLTLKNDKGGMRQWLAQLVALALCPRSCSVPAVILERSEGSERDYSSKDFTVFTYDGSPIAQSDMREPSHLPDC